MDELSAVPKSILQGRDFEDYQAIIPSACKANRDAMNLSSNMSPGIISTFQAQRKCYQGQRPQTKFDSCSKSSQVDLNKHPPPYERAPDPELTRRQRQPPLEKAFCDRFPTLRHLSNSNACANEVGLRKLKTLIFFFCPQEKSWYGLLGSPPLLEQQANGSQLVDCRIVSRDLRIHIASQRVLLLCQCY
ncbi:hypothetical protein CHS0354_037205 [Potamilus streckersoni]|uniref:Uncharacterized protein n=1 Tax=Potamilus streckersoni TaxID=2493646 RepID=A0AAE0SXJ2_9BIVA|nr:hypothetical protein CHS0354_037205 [Potamilus streckersoni]